MFEVRWDPIEGVILDRFIGGTKQGERIALQVLQTMFSWLPHETWLWLVTPDGTLRFAPEIQKHRYVVL